MAESLRRFADALEGAEDFDAALHTLIQDSLRAVIPGKLLQEMSKIVDGTEDDDPVELCFGDKQLLLRVNRTQVYATLLEGEYINYRSIIPASFKTTVKVLDREQLMLCIERASLMARESKTNLVKLSISPDMMVITSNSEMGDVYEEIQTQRKRGASAGSYGTSSGYTGGASYGYGGYAYKARFPLGLKKL